jgi:hypothetical protein
MQKNFEAAATGAAVFMDDTMGKVMLARIVLTV